MSMVLATCSVRAPWVESCLCHLSQSTDAKLVHKGALFSYVYTLELLVDTTRSCLLLQSAIKFGSRQLTLPAEEVDDLDEVLNESIMDSIVGKRRAAEAHTKRKRKRRTDDDDDDDEEMGY